MYGYMSQLVPRRASGIGFLRGVAENTARGLAQRASNAAWNHLKRKVTSSGTSSNDRNKKPRYARKSGGKNYSTSAAQPNTRVVRKDGPSKKKARSVRFKKPPRVKVNKYFKARVTKALEPRRTSGFIEYRDTNYVRYTVDNEQSVYYAGFMTSEAMDSITQSGQSLLPWHFTPWRVLDSASVLFNGKLTPTYNPALIGTNELNVVTDTLKIHVRKSWATYQFRNGTERPQYLSVWTVAPKSVDAPNDELFFNQWYESIQAEKTQKILLSSGTTFRQMDLKPNAFIQMRRKYKMVETKITVEPGQCFDYVVPGPEDFTYTYAKYYEDSNFKNLQKMCRAVVVCAVQDLAINYTAGDILTAMKVARVGNRPLDTSAGNNVVSGMCIEYREFYDITMPEQAGFTYPAAFPPGSQQPLNNRRPMVKYYYNWNTVATGTTDARVDPEVPSSININQQ